MYELLLCVESKLVSSGTVTESRKCSYKNGQRDRYLIYVDKTEPSPNDAACQRSCDKERDFNCRSFSFLTPVGSCIFFKMIHSLAVSIGTICLYVFSVVYMHTLWNPGVWLCFGTQDILCHGMRLNEKRNQKRFPFSQGNTLRSVSIHFHQSLSILCNSKILSLFTSFTFIVATMQTCIFLWFSSQYLDLLSRQWFFSAQNHSNSHRRQTESSDTQEQNITEQYILILLIIIIQHVPFWTQCTQKATGAQAAAGVCLLSGNTASNAAPNAFQVQTGAIYSERECDPRAIPGSVPSETSRPYPPGPDPYPSDPRPYPPTSRHPFPPGRVDPYPTSVRDPPYPTSSRDPYPSSRYPSTSRSPYPARDRDYYTSRDNYIRDPYPSGDPYRRDKYRDGYSYSKNRVEPYPSAYPGSQDPGNYLDPDLTPYRCRYTVTYEKVMGYTYNGGRR